MKILRRFLSIFFKNKGAPDVISLEINYAGLEAALQYSISKHSYFREALSHRSYQQVSGKKDSPTNERLEYLGDSVLNLVVGDYLFHLHPNAEEGELTKIRSRLVNRKALSILACQINLTSFILLSPSALQVSEKGLETILSDAFEAIIGAIYLDGGFDEARKFILTSLRKSFEKNLLKLEDDNYKSQLLEHAQSLGLGNPRYSTVSESGPDHDRIFTIEVFIGKYSYGTGLGKNKKAAEQSAAADALQKLIVNKRDINNEHAESDN
ncbi:MAG: ribonuclease III [Ignavibacteriales bacterium]|nr:ribonuclease III [Ignavibacteriales bacterium]